MVVTISPKYQVVIPKEIRKNLKIEKGQKLQVLATNGIIHLVPDVPIKNLKGVLKGMNISNHRDEKDRI